MGTGSGSVSGGYPASSKCAAHERKQQLDVCVNGFTPLQLSVEYENAAVERVDQGYAAHLSPPPGVCAVCGRWWWRHGVPAVCTLQVCQVLQRGVSAHTLAHAQGELRGGLGQLGARTR
jgi:hypothetical protein